MHLKDLKKKSPAELVEMAEEIGIEGASTMRKQDLMFAILKAQAEQGEQIMGVGTIEVLPDGFGFLRSPEANYLAGPDDIYVSPNQVRKFGLRTGDTVEGEIRAPKDGERYFALTRLASVNFDDPDAVRHRVNFDNLTPLYPNEKLRLDTLDPTVKDKSARVIDIVAPRIAIPKDPPSSPIASLTADPMPDRSVGTLARTPLVACGRVRRPISSVASGRAASTGAAMAASASPGPPRTSTGKILRRSLRAPYWEGRERQVN